MNINKLRDLFIAACCFVIALCSEIQCMDEKDQLFPRVKSSALGVKPGPSEWLDELSHPAPAQVRKAADKLWENVEREGAAAFDAGGGFSKKMPCGPKRCCAGFLMCGILECILARGEYDIFVWHPAIGNRSTQIIHEQRNKELMEALAEFKDAVNQSVNNPVQYSGDANICVLGPWIEDGAWTYGPEFVSGRRDLSGVTQSTRAFVNSHGGWVTQSNETLRF